MTARLHPCSFLSLLTDTMAVPFLGNTITLISKSDVRYQVWQMRDSQTDFGRKCAALSLTLPLLLSRILNRRKFSPFFACPKRHGI